MIGDVVEFSVLEKEKIKKLFLLMGKIYATHCLPEKNLYSKIQILSNLKKSESLGP